MKVSEAGEFGLIGRLAAVLGAAYPPRPDGRPRRGLLVDLGDDALVARRRDGALVLTTDTLVAGIHFLPERTPWAETGWKALAVNVSDIAAMGAAPDLALVTLALPADYEVDDALALYVGLREAAEAFGVTICGGDVVRAPVFSVTVALSGWAMLSETGAPLVLTRAAARPGDVVAVSGQLGDSAGGLLLLREGRTAPDGAAAGLIAAHERPQPRVALGRAAVAAGVRCAIDVSDGLVQDLGHIARASAVAIRLDAARVPVGDGLRALFPERAFGLALTGGEDYELLLVAPAPVLERVRARVDVPLTEVGAVVAADSRGRAGVSVVDESGRDIPLEKGGWDHFGR